MDLVGIEPSRVVGRPQVTEFIMDEFPGMPSFPKYLHDTYTVHCSGTIEMYNPTCPAELLMATSYRVLFPVRFAVECPLVALALQPGRAEAQDVGSPQLRLTAVT